jgi:hypothetical protein
MTQDEWPIDEPITYAHEEDDTESEDELVPENIALPGHPLYKSEDLATDSIEEGAQTEEP